MIMETENIICDLLTILNSTLESYSVLFVNIFLYRIIRVGLFLMDNKENGGVSTSKISESII